VVNQFDVQADNEDDTAYLARMTSHLVPCLGQMAVTAGTDVIWKPLNTQVLLKTREDRAATRIAALQTVEEFYQRLGEEFLVLLPETIPFLAELMEGKCITTPLQQVHNVYLLGFIDDDPAVERLTQQVIAVIERYLGESLQKYFE
jgi:U3 small nucleolar RNA-associated protein 10